MPLSTADWAAISLSLQLATVTTCILLLLGTPLAWWLARTGSWLKAPLRRSLLCLWFCRLPFSDSICSWL